MKKLGQEPAFSREASFIPTHVKGGGESFKAQQGMSKRFYAACAAMQGILASYAGLQIAHFPEGFIASESYKMADELLKQEEE